MIPKDYNYGYVDLDGEIRLIWRSDKTASPDDEWQGQSTAPYANEAHFMKDLKELQSRRRSEL